MIKKIVLQNGLRIVFIPQPGSLTATILILVEAGSEYETEKINGVSHFLEHLTFKGTAKRPKAGMIAEELDALGAQYNAFTGQEYTGYWAKAENQKLPEILEIVADMYLNPIFSSEEIEKERGVIIEEINMYEDMPMRKIHSLFLSLLYGNQPAGWDIIGQKEVINRLQREDFLGYHSRHYLPQATVVAVAGHFHQDIILAILKKNFVALKRRRKDDRPKIKERQTKPGILLKFKESDQSHLVLGSRAFDIFDERKHALYVLAEVLGGGMSSRLFHRVRGELGAAYYIHADAELSLDHGYFAVSAGADNKRVKQVTKAILDELNRSKKELVGRAELQKAKEHFTGNFILGLESSDELASFYGVREVLNEKLLSPPEVISKIKRVSAKEVRQVARYIFKNDRLNLALIGSYRKTDQLRKILKYEQN